jgi:hypothetical protein
MTDIEELLGTFLQIAKLSHLEISRSDIQHECLPPPHTPPTRIAPQQPIPGWDKGLQATYAFFLGDLCLKVGKVSPNSTARFTSQHYGITTGSTLAKSLLAQRDAIAGLQTLSETSVGPWLKRNTSRFHVFLHSEQPAAALSLLEAFLQCRFRPLFEGKIVAD